MGWQKGVSLICFDSFWNKSEENGANRNKSEENGASRNKSGHSWKQGAQIGTNREKTGKSEQIGTNREKTEQIGTNRVLKTRSANWNESGENGEIGTNRDDPLLPTPKRGLWFNLMENGPKAPHGERWPKNRKSPTARMGEKNGPNLAKTWENDPKSHFLPFLFLFPLFPHFRLSARFPFYTRPLDSQVFNSSGIDFTITAQQMGPMLKHR